MTRKEKAHENMSAGLGKRGRAEALAMFPALYGKTSLLKGSGLKVLTLE